MARSAQLNADPKLACLSAVTAILDLANGLDDDKSLFTGLFALDLAEQAGLAEPERRAAFFAALLRHLGCTAYAASESQVVPDDIRLRNELLHCDTSRPRNVVAAVRAASSPLQGLRGLARLATTASTMRAEWTHEACGAAKLLAEQLGFGPLVVRALDEVFERWDGGGSPHGAGGSDISPVGRVAQVAHLAVIFWLAGGVTTALEVLRLRSGAELDPAIARLAIDRLSSFDIRASDPERIEQAERVILAEPLELSLETIAATFGDVGDLQSPFTRGHSRRVVDICERAARELGMSDEQRRELVLAAHLHDLGHLAIPTGVWLRKRWSEPERRRAATHTFVTERVLAAAPELHEVARIAGAHHERLDGSGYHRGHGHASLDRSARLLAVADVLCAVREDRPHRPAHGPSAVRELMHASVRDGLLDGDCVAAALRAVGERPLAIEESAIRELTARELDVLRLLVKGQTNKAIGVGLGISARTVQHHTIHIYEKLGVGTRAAAALVAVRGGLV